MGTRFQFNLAYHQANYVTVFLVLCGAAIVLCPPALVACLVLGWAWVTLLKRRSLKGFSVYCIGLSVFTVMACTSFLIPIVSAMIACITIVPVHAVICKPMLEMGRELMPAVDNERGTTVKDVSTRSEPPK